MIRFRIVQQTKTRGTWRSDLSIAQTVEDVKRATLRAFSFGEPTHAEDKRGIVLFKLDEKGNETR